MFVFKAAVAGAGKLGGEVAHALAAAGIPVVLSDADPDRLELGIRTARELLQAPVDAGRLQPVESERLQALIAATASHDGFGDVDFVVVSAGDDLDEAYATVSELDAVLPGRAIIGFNSSSTSIDELAFAADRSDKLVGFHFVTPVATNRLVEVVEGERTSAETVQTALNLAQAIRKLPILCADSPGLVVDRLRATQDRDPGSPDDRATLLALVESCLLLDEGAAAMKDIDAAAAAGAGISPPPLAAADAVGLERVLESLELAAERIGPELEPPAVLRRLVAQGRLGVSTGQGFYPYARPDEGWAERPLKLETRGELAIAWLDRPPANSLSPEVVQTLDELWEQVSRAGVRALVFASAAPALFCAGADIKAFTRLDGDSARALVDDMHRVLRAMETSRVVTIAAVNGLAYGGGCELAMACDFRIAAESASFGQPEINLGIIPGFGGTQRLRRLVGQSRALELNLTGDPIGAYEAQQLGLANRVVPDHELLDEALAWARKLSGQAPIAIELIKQVSAAGELDAGIEAEKDAFVTAFTTADAREGIAAFLGKRAPTWEGR